MTFDLYIDDRLIHSFPTLCHAYSYCHYHEIVKATIKLGNVIVGSVPF